MDSPRLDRILSSAMCLMGTTLWIGCSDVDLGGDPAGPAEPTGPSGWTMLGGDYASTFHNRVEDTLDRSNVGDLKLHWAFKPAGPANGTPAVVDGVVYATSTGGTYALDADSGAVLWENPDLRSTASPTYFDGTLYVHTNRGLITALDPATGEVHWQTPSDENRFTSGYSSPVVTDRYVITGASSGEEGAAADNATFKGGVIALDRETGERVWRHYTAIDPYNGATVWSTVTIDLEARRVFATTGNNYTGEAGPNSDSIFSLDLDTGELAWTTQLTEGDVFTILSPRSPDSDFGTNPTLFEAEVDGVTRKMLAAGQKSGVVWGLDRETGEVLWERTLSGGSALIGGILNAGAYDGERLLVVANEFTGADAAQLAALDPATGEVLWQRSVPHWVWAPITVTNGIAFVSTWTVLRAYDATNGEELFVETPGTITSGAAIVDGRIYFGSGMAYLVGESESGVYALSLPGDDAPAPQPTATPEPSGVSFTSIYQDVFLGAGCASGSCHGANAGELSFDTQQVAYDELVGVPAGGSACALTGMLRVSPGNPEGSLLMDKVASEEPACGDGMPIAGMLDPDQIERIRSWIAGGATND